MSEILSVIWNNLFSINIPVINITFKTFLIGMFIVFFLISFIRRQIRKDGE